MVCIVCEKEEVHSRMIPVCDACEEDVLMYPERYQKDTEEE